MRRIFSAVIAAVVLLVMAGPAHPQLIRQKTELPEWFRKQLHRWSDYKILVVKGSTPSSAVDRLAAAPDDFRIVVWQALPEHTREADVKRVLAWVAEGGTLWFQDSRLGPVFGGFENAPIGGADMPAQGFKTARGAYGDVSKAEGANMFGVANPGGGHPVLSGVDYVQIFTIKVGDAATSGGAPTSGGAAGGLFSAVRRAADVIPLLRYDPTSNTPVSDRLAAGLKSYGDGTIVFKPLVWEELYTGGRFQWNLLEWSSGFGVPDMTASGPSGQRPRRRSQTVDTALAAADPSLDRVTCYDKRVVEGTIITKALKITVFEPVLSTSMVEMGTVRAVEMQSDGTRDAVVLASGQRLLGSVTFPDDLTVRTPAGATQKLKKSEILRIRVHDAAAAPEKKGN